MSPKDDTSRFFALTFAFTWGLQLPGVFAQRGILPGAPGLYLPFVALGIFGPLAAAAYLTGRATGRPGLRELFGSLVQWRAPLRVYGVAVLLPPLLLSLVLLGLRAAGREGPSSYVPSVGAAFVGLLISVSEEVGWRGYALPRLERRYGRFAAAGILGVLWYVWHLPMFVGLGVPLNLALVMVLFFVGSSLLMSWAAHASGGSLFVAALIHFGAHLNNSHRALPSDLAPLLVHAIVLAGMGSILMRKQAASRPSEYRSGPRWASALR